MNNFVKLDKDCEYLLKDLYKSFINSTDEQHVSEPKYNKLQIDYLKDLGLLRIKNVSTLDKWKYFIYPTYAGKEYFNNLKKIKKRKVRETITKIIKFFYSLFLSFMCVTIYI